MYINQKRCQGHSRTVLIPVTFLPSHEKREQRTITENGTRTAASSFLQLVFTCSPSLLIRTRQLTVKDLLLLVYACGSLLISADIISSSNSMASC